MANPIKLDGIDMMDTQPVWRPKYMLAEHITVPTPRPTATPRTVKLRPGGDGEAIIASPAPAIRWAFGAVRWSVQ